METVAVPEFLDFKRDPSQFSAIPEPSETTLVTIVPRNGVSFGPSQYIEVFSSLEDSFIHPYSQTISYSAAYTNTANARIGGVPLYSNFRQIDTYINGTQLTSESNVNIIQNAIANLTLSSSQKVGAGSCYGYEDDITTADGRALAGVDTRLNLSGPLNTTLANVSQGFPLGKHLIRMVFWINPIADIGVQAGGAVTNVAITNFQWNYNALKLPPSLTNQILMKSEKIYFKTQTILVSQKDMSSFGTQQIEFGGVRAKSIRAMFCMFAPTTNNAQCVNNRYDSVDFTNGLAAGVAGAGGSYQFICNGKLYPQQELATSSIGNKSNILTELKKSSTALMTNYTNLFDKNNEMAIVPSEWNAIGVTTATTSASPGKFIVSTLTERSHSSNLNSSYFWSGITTASQNIFLKVQVNPVAGGVVTIPYTATLFVVADSVIELNMVTNQASLIVA